MKYTDINRRFTEIAAEYLAKGFVINTTTMSGSQGERAHIDLTDGVKVIRILVEDFRDFAKPGCEGTEIIVGGNGSRGVEANLHRERGIIWNGELERLHTERFYKLGEDKRTGEPFYGTEQESKAAAERRRTHWRNAEGLNAGFTELPLEGRRLEIARSLIQRRLGVKRITNADIKLRKNSAGYYIVYRSETLKLR